MTSTPEPHHSEILDSSGGHPATSSGGSRKRRGILAGAGVAVLAVVGGGAWAATSFFSTGDQAAQALPADTIGYLSVDLDPDGSQKIAALGVLNKFPAFEDKVGVSGSDDLRQKIATYVLDQSDCDVDYAADIEPWLGNRFAVAAVDTGGDTPSPAAVVQVSDESAADEGLKALAACDDSGETAWSINDGWAVISETQDAADTIAADAADASLADDASFQRWTAETGDAGIATGYVSADLVSVLEDQGDELPGLGSSLEGFEGAAATLRFADGAVEVESATSPGSGGVAKILSGDGGMEALTTLPEDTAAAIAIAPSEGWGSALVDYIETFAGVLDEDASGGDFLTQAEAATGLTLPDDLETLLGETAVLAVGGDIDLDSITASADGSDVPVALKVQGDPSAIEQVVDKIRSNPAFGGVGATLLGSDTEGDFVAIGPSNTYREQVLSDGDLGGSDLFSSVVPDAEDSSVVFFVNLDALDDLIDQATGVDAQIVDNIKPLAAIGASSSTDGDVVHGLVKITTDD